MADFNSEVKAGQVIARIDPASFEAKLAQAEAELAVARANVETQRATLQELEADLAGSEAALAPPTAERATLLYWKDVIDFINNAGLAVGDLCLEESEPRLVRLRRSQRMSRN